MSGETARIAEIAERLSTEIFSFLRWQILTVGLMNQNFKCVNQKIHRISKEKQITNLKAQFEQEIKTKQSELNDSFVPFQKSLNSLKQFVETKAQQYKNI